MWWQTEAFIQRKLFCTVPFSQPSVCPMQLTWLARGGEFTASAISRRKWNLCHRGSSLSHSVQAACVANTSSYPVCTEVHLLDWWSIMDRNQLLASFKAESKNTSNHTATSSYVFMAYCLIKHKVDFIRLCAGPDISKFYHLEMTLLNPEAETWLLLFAVCGNADFNYRAIGLLPCLGRVFVP